MTDMFVELEATQEELESGCSRTRAPPLEQRRELRWSQ